MKSEKPRRLSFFILHSDFCISPRYHPRPMSSTPPSKSWQSRISEATDAIAQTFVESMSYDWRLYKADIAGSIAHATMLAKVKLITDDERDKIVEGLKGIERDIEAGNF